MFSIGETLDVLVLEINVIRIPNFKFKFIVYLRNVEVI